MTALRSNKVAVIIDGPDPDNYILALVASSAFFGMDVVAVIMTGRPVSIVRDMPPYGFNPHASRAVRRDNALHCKGVLTRHGREHIPVFEGGRAPFSSIPHDRPFKERMIDVFDDAHAGYELAGDIDDAVVHLASLEGPINVIVGGPLTDLDYLMRQPMLGDKLGIVTAQLGMFGFGQVKTMAGGRRQFNALADPTATHGVLSELQSPIYLVSTDITKHAGHAFGHPDYVAALLSGTAAGDEVVAMYRATYPHMWKPRDEQIYFHDFHPAELMSYLLAMPAPHHQTFGQHDNIGRYQATRVGIKHVPHLWQPLSERERWGEIDLGPIDPDLPLRFLIDGVDTSKHHSVLAAALASPAYQRAVSSNTVKN